MSLLLDEEHGVNPSVLVCFLCGKDDAILLAGRLPGGGEAPRSMTHYTVKGKRGAPDTKHTHTCPDCDKMREIGIMLIEVQDEDQYYRTGRLFVITEEAFNRVFTGLNVPNRAAFIPVSVVESLGIDKIDPVFKDVPGD